MRLPLFLLKKSLFPSGGNVLSYALWISVFGVMLSIALLILVLAVMSGFLDLLEHRYTTITSDMVIVPRQSMVISPDFRDKLEHTPGVVAVTPFLLSQGMAVHGGVGGINIEGVELESAKKVTPYREVWVEGPDDELQKKNGNWIWIGKQLQTKLNLHLGDSIDVLLPEEGGSRVLPFLVSGVMKFGIYDHDLHHTVISIDHFKEVLGHRSHPYSNEPMYKMKLAGDGDVVSATLKRDLSAKATVRRWYEIYHNLFYAVQHQKQMLFVVLEIVVGLAALNVINLLVMNSHQRRRDIAILRTMGFRFQGVVTFFVAQGIAVGMVGTLFGVLLGCVVCKFVEWFQPELLNESIYNVTRLPLKVDWADVLWVVMAALLICLIFSVIPGWRAARRRPVEVLRYE